MRWAFALALAACAHGQVVDDREATDDDPEDPSDQLPVVAARSGTLIAEAERELAAMQTSRYDHHTRVDEPSGRFDYDCSGFVGYALAQVSPEALHAVVEASQHTRPLAKHFEAAFETPLPPWHAVARVDALEPGDVIAWLEPADIISRNTGHVMIVERAPHPASRPNELVVPVIDSSHSWHGHRDSRHAGHHGGLGRGEIVIVVDGAGAPVAYRWSNTADSLVHHTAIKFGRVR